MNERKQQFWEATPSRQHFYVRELMNINETQAKSTDKIQTANKRKQLFLYLNKTKLFYKKRSVKYLDLIITQKVFGFKKKFDNNFC